MNQITKLSDYSTMSLIFSLFQHLSFKRRLQFFCISILMIIVAFTEIISIGAVLPFIGVLTQPERVFEFEILQPIIVTL